MKSNFTIISLFCLLVWSCSQDELQGTWVLAYTDSPTSISVFNEIITFQDGNYQSESFAGPTYYEKSNGKFELTKEYLILNDSIRLKIKYVSRDSLEIADESSSYTFKKLSDSLKSTSPGRIELVDKTFKATNDRRINGKVNYKKDQLILKPDSENESTIPYKRINHNGFDLIFQEYAAPKVIYGIKEDTIHLFIIHKKIYPVKMWEI